jgi:hypothetical protein
MIHDFMRMLKRHLRPSETETPETQAERRTVGTIRNAEWLPTNLPRLNIPDEIPDSCIVDFGLSDVNCKTNIFFCTLQTTTIEKSNRNYGNERRRHIMG